eukprot:3853751-Karenia_brevis.AAC.1
MSPLLTSAFLMSEVCLHIGSGTNITSISISAYHAVHGDRPDGLTGGRGERGRNRVAEIWSGKS